MLFVLASAHLLITSASAETFRVPPSRAGACSDGQRCEVLTLAPAFALTLGRVSHPGSEAEVGLEVSPGLGATLLLARGTYEVTDGPGGRAYTVERSVPYLYLGATGQTGWIQTGDGSANTTTISGIVGSRFLGLQYGYDVGRGETFIGVAAVVTGASLSPRAAGVLAAWR